MKRFFFVAASVTGTVLLSVERLMSFLTALQQDIEIVIRGRAGLRRSGRIVVRAA